MFLNPKPGHKNSPGLWVTRSPSEAACRTKENTEVMMMLSVCERS